MYKLLVVLMLTVCVGVQAKRIEGVLIYEFGDSKPPAIESSERYYLQTSNDIIPISLSDAFQQKMPIRAWAGQKVAITFKTQQLSLHRENSIQAMELLGSNTISGGITGAQPWVSILCKFSDIATEPKDLSFFQNMYANQPAGLDHYWREVSYDNINTVGSVAVDWVDLPSPQTTYIPVPGEGQNSDRNLLFDDCTAAADPFVNYANGANGDAFVGINMMFNDDLDCCAWGGGRYRTLDGLQQLWRTTWNPPWSFANEGVIAHEMGHGMGLPHANNSDGDDNPYDSPWDVMSSATGYGVNDGVYGRLGKHINMHYKHVLGWVDDNDGFIANIDSDNEVIIDWTSSLSSSNYRFVRIPLTDGTFYVVESRLQSGQYEGSIVDTAVIIHHVVIGRSQPPWLVDEDVPPANYSDNEGVMWKVGETFVDPIEGYQVEVLEQVASGFRIQVTGLGDLIFKHGFE